MEEITGVPKEESLVVGIGEEVIEIQRGDMMVVQIETMEIAIENTDENE